MTPQTKDPSTQVAPGETAAPPVIYPVTVEVRVRLQALAIPEADGGFSVIVPALPGCVTHGDTIEEVVENLQDVAELWLRAGHDLEKAEGASRLVGRVMVSRSSGKRMCKVLQARGWRLLDITSSHHLFVREGHLPVWKLAVPGPRQSRSTYGDSTSTHATGGADRRGPVIIPETYFVSLHSYMV